MCFRVYTGRYTSSVVGNLNHVAGENIYVYLCAVACEGFVDSVVDYLVHEVVEAVRAAGADVHTGAFSYSFKAFEDLYLIFVVVIIFVNAGDLSRFDFLGDDLFSVISGKLRADFVQILIVFDIHIQDLTSSFGNLDSQFPTLLISKLK